jgi:hypothetical protein
VTDDGDKPDAPDAPQPPVPSGPVPKPATYDVTTSAIVDQRQVGVPPTPPGGSAAPAVIGTEAPASPSQAAPGAPMPSVASPVPLVPSWDSDAPPLAAGPASSTEADLRDAVGARQPRRERTRRDKELDALADAAAKGVPDSELDPFARDERRGRRRSMTILAILIIVAVGITSAVLLGRANQDNYYLTCSATEIRAEQGRGFPPWGSAPIDGPEWKPIAIPPDARCQPRHLEDVASLRALYLAALIAQAERGLAAGADAVRDVDGAAKQLDQALLLSRDEAARDTRKKIERLRGDVEHWRAAARLAAALVEIEAAAKQFDDADQRQPHNVGNSAAWAALARRAAAALSAGPDGAGFPADVAAPAPRPPAPMGTALPVDSPAPDASMAPVPEVGPPDAAGLPAGGVLL